MRIVLPLQVVSHQSLFSNKLYLKCLPVPLSKFLVGVVLDCSKDSINTQLHLVNTDSLKIYPSLNLMNPCVQVVDICLIQDWQNEKAHKDGLFVCLTADRISIVCIWY